MEVMKDIAIECSKHVTKILTNIGCVDNPVADNIKALILYGSYAYQDLDAPIVAKSDTQIVIDKKPDFIAIVSNIEDTIQGLAQRYGWSWITAERLLNLRKDTPHYFNLQTTKKYEIQTLSGTCKRQLPYKLGIIELNGFEKAMSKKGHNIYLPARLSKFFNVLSINSEFKQDFESYLKQTREFFVDLTLRTLPKRFTGEDFARRYLQTTYLAEAYRVFDITKKKHLSILESQLYNMETDAIVPMREMFHGIIAPIVGARDDIQMESNSSFYDSCFQQKQSNNHIGVLVDFVLFNMVSVVISCHKNRITNSTAGSSNLQYLIRKFR